MSDTATIHVDRVFPGRKAGKGEVFDVRTVDGSKYAAWGAVGEALHSLGSGVVDVEYEPRPKNGYENLTILSFKEGASNGSTQGTSVARSTPTDPKGAQINRSVAFKGAVDLVVAFGSADSPLDALAQVGALTEDALLIVDASLVADDAWMSKSLEDTE